MQMAEKFGRPIICLVDTPAAYPGVESEERGIAEAIAVNLREMSALNVPIAVLVTGEGGSGGALGIAVGDWVMMQEFAVYSVIPPEGCAAILWRDPTKKVEAANALKLTATDLLSREIVDQVIPEPSGGAHHDHDLAARLLDEALWPVLQRLMSEEAATRLERRYLKFRSIGRLGHEIAGAPTDAVS
jgi:acetyl-CoA carboxylase carboxyl transferase subunit alpha